LWCGCTHAGGQAATANVGKGLDRGFRGDPLTRTSPEGAVSVASVTAPLVVAVTVPVLLSVARFIFG
jgi:hypothetical protein